MKKHKRINLERKEREKAEFRITELYRDILAQYNPNDEDRDDE